MKLGVQISRFDFAGEPATTRQCLTAIAQAAEAAGLYSAWVMDHFLQLPAIGPKTDPMMEAYTTLGFLAGVTQKLKLGTLVTGVIYREPAVLIKAVTALDVVSGGRAYFGIGAGWFEEEAVALGLPNPLTSQRFDKLEDILRLAKQMWQDDRTPFRGQAYQLPEPISRPRPVSQPHPPILIGGGGEQKTLRLVAQYGDACNLFGRLGLAEVRRKLEVLRQHCAEVGRNYDEIEKTVLATVDIDGVALHPEALIRQAHEFGELGVTQMILSASPSADPQAYERLAPTVAELAAWEPAAN